MPCYNPSMRQVIKLKLEVIKQQIRQTVINFKKFIKNYRFLVKPALIFAAIFIIGIFALVRANFNYYDDYGRINEGYQYWDQFGRHLSNFFSTLLHTNTSLADISPLTQFIACIIMGCTAAIAVYVITGKKQFKFYHYLAAVPISLSPYFLECYAYKFDAPYMALSVLASVFPFLFFSNETKRTFYVVAFLSAIVMCMTYQASNGIFFILLLLLELKTLVSQPSVNARLLLKTIKHCVLCALPYLLSMLIFKMLFAPSFNGGYASTTLPALKDIPSTFVTNLFIYLDFVRYDFNATWTGLIAAVLLLFLIFIIIKAKCNKVLALIMSLLFLTCVGIGSFGIYPALEAPLRSPHAMYGITAALGFVCIYTAELMQGKYANLFRLPIFAISWCFFVYAYIYGNALSQQQEYANFRLNQTLTTLSQNNIITKDTKVINVINDPEFAPAILNSVAHYPILERSVYKVYYALDVWGQYKLLNYYGLNVAGEISDNAPLATKNPCYQNDECQILETYYDTIYYNDEAILIELK